MKDKNFLGVNYCITDLFNSMMLFLSEKHDDKYLDTHFDFLKYCLELIYDVDYKKFIENQDNNIQLIKFLLTKKYKNEKDFIYTLDKIACNIKSIEPYFNLKGLTKYDLHDLLTYFYESIIQYFRMNKKVNGGTYTKDIEKHIILLHIVLKMYYPNIDTNPSVKEYKNYIGELVKEANSSGIWGNDTRASAYLIINDIISLIYTKFVSRQEKIDKLI